MDVTCFGSPEKSHSLLNTNCVISPLLSRSAPHLSGPVSQMRGYPSLIAYGDLERVQCTPLILETSTAETTRAGVSVGEPAGGFLSLLPLERGVLLLEAIVRQRRQRACLSCGPLVTKGVPRGCALRVCRLGRGPARQEVVSGGKKEEMLGAARPWDYPTLSLAGLSGSVKWPRKGIDSVRTINTNV